MEFVRVAIEYDYCFAVSSRGRGGGLALFWNKEFKVELKSFSFWHIDVWVTDASVGIPWQLTGFYGHPDESLRSQSWSLLRRLKECGATPWLCLGDFNELRASHEKVGGPPKPSRLMSAFNTVIEDCGFKELKWKGPKMTWSRGREGRRITLERLDRALATANWFQLFDSPIEEHLVERRSDHLPLLIHCNGLKVHPKVERRFRFENMWTREVDCEKIVSESWLGRDCVDKIASCSGALSFWNDTKFGNLQNKIRTTQSQLKEALKRGDRGLGLDEVQRLQGELDELLCKEEILWRQRSKQLWLKEGDKNTSFFHSTATKRKQTNAICALKDENGEERVKKEELESIAVNYFTNLFASCCDEDAVNKVASLIQPRVTAEMNDVLLLPFGRDEIKQALDSMEPSKSPGPDGMNACFFQRYWHIVGNDVTNLVLSILNGEEDVEVINETYIVLIPKVKSPLLMSEFRPISLCNIVYKLVSKVLANRLQSCLADVISISQSAFVSGRSIYDNSMVAHEVIHTMQRHKRGREGEIALKLDMSKAFDRVEWKYLNAVMEALGFASTFRTKIMACVETVRYAVLINGNPTVSFSPRRGIRQGDPLSPYLFIMCVEGFSALIAQACCEQRMNGVKASVGGPEISHLFFADDSLIFMQEDERDCVAMKDVLSQYEKASGQYINLSKSAIFFSANVRQRQRESLMNILGVTKLLGSDKYLGLPLMFGRAIQDEFDSIKEKINARLQSWNGKLLSQHGRGVLIRSVLQAIPTYTMGCFKLPATLIKSINGVVAAFWWSSKRDKKKIHWLSWDRLCCSKMEGGQGFKDLSNFNKAMLAKTWWRIIHDDSLLAHKVLAAKYCDPAPLKYAWRANKCSYLWKSLMEGKEVVDAGAYYRIGDGNDTDVWMDRWVRDAPDCRVQWCGGDIPPLRSVSTLIDSNAGQWKTDVLERLFSSVDVERVKRIPLSCVGGRDMLIWRETPNGEFSVRSAYVVAKKLSGSQTCDRGGRNQKWKRIWSAKVAPKVQHFFWKAAHNICPTVSVLRSRGLLGQGGCPICQESNETLLHAIFFCPLSASVWTDICSASWEFAMAHINDDDFWLAWLSEMSRFGSLELCMTASWSLWKNRNKVLHEGHGATKDALVRMIFDFWKGYVEANVVLTNRDNLQARPVVWVAPREGWLKINVDAAFQESSGRTTVAAVARNSEGQVLFSAAQRLQGVSSVLHAELAAVLLGLTVAVGRVQGPLIIESDSLQSVQEIKKRGSSLSPWGAVLMSIHEVSKSLQPCVFQFVKREANMLAHDISQLSLISDHVQTWDSLPNQIVTISS